MTKCAGSRFAVAFLHLHGNHYPLQTFSGTFQLEPDWLNLVGLPFQQLQPNPGASVRPHLPIDIDVLRMTSMLPSDDSDYNL
jgi:hypothetical protein